MGSSPSKLNEFAAPIFDPEVRTTSLDWDDEKGMNPETIEGVLSNAEHKIADVKIADKVAWYFKQLSADPDNKKKSQIQTSKRVYEILVKGCLQHCSAYVKDVKPDMAANVRYVAYCTASVGVAINHIVTDSSLPNKDAQKLYGTVQTANAIQHVLENDFKGALEDDSIAELFRAIQSIVDENETNKNLFATSHFASAIANALKTYCDSHRSLFLTVQAIGMISEGNQTRSTVFSTNKDLIAALAGNFEKASRNELAANQVAIGIHKMMEANSVETNAKLLENTMFSSGFEKLQGAVDGKGKEAYDAVQTLIYNAVTSNVMKM